MPLMGLLINWTWLKKDIWPEDLSIESLKAEEQRKETKNKTKTNTEQNILGL